MLWESSTLGSHCSKLQVPSFIINERTEGTTVTSQGPKEEPVAAHVSMMERMISIQEKNKQNEETKANQSVFSKNDRYK